MDDDSTLAQLDAAWNSAYSERRRHKLRDVLSEDFLAFFPDGASLEREALIAAEAPPEATLESSFSEFSLHVFGNTAVTRGRVEVSVDAELIQQRFMRVWAKRQGRWWAVAVQVFPVTD